MAIEKEAQLVPIKGLVAVLKEHGYQQIERTSKVWVFKSKNPDAYCVALPASETSVPATVVRNALLNEPLDMDEVLDHAISNGNARQSDDDEDSPLVIDLEEARRVLTTTPHPRVELSPEEMEKIEEFTEKVKKESLEIRDEDRINVSGNMDDYLDRRL